MDLNSLAPWAPLGSLLWIVFVISLSVIYRRAAGKPVVPKVPANALFVERQASGFLASNCLIVAVTDEALIVTPRFPFNLMFLPEIYGLEHTLPRGTIKEVVRKNSWVGNNVLVTYGEGKRVGLRVVDPDRLVAVLRTAKRLDRPE